MFEKEADKWVSNHFKLYLREPSIVIAKHAFKDGAKFGYNKANEWHKPSEKLPEEGSLVLVYLFEEKEPTMCEYVVSDQWECLPKKIVFCSNDQVRMWKEIVLPELKESE